MKREDVIITDQFVLFWNGWPSQWFPAGFVAEGMHYRCCEQYMMAEKARIFNDMELLERILAAVHPREQKSLGRKVRNFDVAVWESVCRGIVFTANLEKFSQNESIRNELLATGSRAIVEASPVDVIWGIGLAPEDPDAQRPEKWRGTNWLGIALMQVRAVLAAKLNGAEVALDPELQKQLERRQQIGGR